MPNSLAAANIRTVGNIINTGTLEVSGRSVTALGFRLLDKLDGTQVLQAGYVNVVSRQIDWVDIPTEVV